jgi:hypothetical protein
VGRVGAADDQADDLQRGQLAASNGVGQERGEQVIVRRTIPNIR